MPNPKDLNVGISCGDTSISRDKKCLQKTMPVTSKILDKVSNVISSSSNYIKFEEYEDYSEKLEELLAKI